MDEQFPLRAVIYYSGFRHRSGGAFQHALVAVDELERRGWHARVVTLDNLPIYARYLPTILGKVINLVHSPLGFAYRGRLTAFLFRRLLKLSADFILFEEIYISWNSKTPSITMLHATWSDNLQGIKVEESNVQKLIRREENILNQIDHPVITVSDEYRDFLTENLFSDRLERFIEVVALSTEFPDLPEVSKRKNSIVFTGRLESRKNPFFLFKVFEAFYARNQQSSLTIIGDGPFLAELKAIAEEKALPVHFLGRLNHAEIFPELQQHDLYIHTSTKESFSFALLEAKLCGLVTCAHGGLQVPGSFIDYPVESFTVEDWVSALEVALDQGPVHHVSYSDYSPQIMIDRTLELAGFESLKRKA